MTPPLRSLLHRCLRRLGRRLPPSYHDVWNACRTPEQARRSIYNETDEGVFDEGGRLDAALVREFLPPDAVVLDIGCGIGRVERHLAPHCRRLIGVDLSERMLRQARARLAGCANLDLRQNNGRDLSEIGDGAIDFVFSFFVLQHLEKEDAFRYLREIRRVLRPDGGFLLQFPRLASSYFDDSFLSDVASGPPYAVARPRLYTPAESAYVLVRAGLLPRRLLLRGDESMLVGARAAPSRPDWPPVAEMLDRSTAVEMYSRFCPQPPAAASPRTLLPGLLAHAAIQAESAGSLVLDAAGEVVVPLTAEPIRDGVVRVTVELLGPWSDRGRPDLSIGIRSRLDPDRIVGPYVQTDSGHGWTFRRRCGDTWTDLPGSIRRRRPPGPAPVRLHLVADGPWLSLYDDQGCLATVDGPPAPGLAYLRAVDTRVRIHAADLAQLDS